MQATATRNPAIRRIMSEWKELKRNKSSRLTAHPLEDNMFEWHFTIRGSADTDFAGGVYHGRILLPHNYPMKPPNIVFLTPNGRFEVGMKICLTVSAHHPETWQPSWSIRTVLTAIIGFMPSPGGGAIGSIDYEPEVRKSMAKDSVQWRCDTCGMCNGEQLPQEDEDELNASNSVLSTSVGALVEEQARFPIDTIRIDKIEKLDESASLDSPNRKPSLNSSATLDSPSEGLRRRRTENDNNAPVEEAAAPAAAQRPPAVMAAANQTSSAGFLDVGIAAVFFLILWLVLTRFV